MSSMSERIADFALALKSESIPEDVWASARLHLLDAIGVGIAASASGTQGHLRQRFATGGAPGMPGATVFGSPLAADPLWAALLNGACIHALEYDDTHMGSIVHGSSILVPVALAAAEQNRLSLADTLTLSIVGWEVMVRLGLAAPGAFQRRGFQITSVAGALVAALMATLARGGSRRNLVDAQGIAGSQASGIFEFLSEGATVKALHPGWAAHAGMVASEFAVAGMTGPTTVYEGRFGLYKTYADVHPVVDALSTELQTLGEVWYLRDAAFKLFPCCHYIHPFLECATTLRPKVAQVADIVAVECLVPEGAADIICRPWPEKQRPTTTGEAKYSLPYCLALALLDIPITPQHFLDGVVDARACDLAGKISWRPMPDDHFPAQFQAEIHVRLANGETLTMRVDDVKGSVVRPASVHEVQEKFLANTHEKFSATAQERLIDVVLAQPLETPITALQNALRDCPMAVEGRPGS